MSPQYSRFQVSGFRSGWPAGRETAVVITISRRILRNLPTTLVGRKFPLQRLLQSIKHPDAFLVAHPEGRIDLVCDVPLHQGHKQVMNRLAGFAPAPIDSFYFIPYVPIIVLLCS